MKSAFVAINKKLNEKTIMLAGTDSRAILISENELRLHLLEYKETLAVSKSWISYLFTLFAFSLSLVTAWEQLGNLWRAVFLAGAIVALIFLSKDLFMYIKYHKKSDVKFFIESIRGEEIKTK